MLPKPCHPGLRPRSRLFGLEPLDLLLLAPGFFVASVMLQRLGLAVVVTALGGVALHTIKWGRLPGYTIALGRYLAFPRWHGVIGAERVPARCRLAGNGEPNASHDACA